MLTEIANVKQEPGQRRRWFEGDGFELIVWYGREGGVEGFQLCHVTPQEERALTWRGCVGFADAQTETGEVTPLKHETSTLTGDVPWDGLARFFAESAVGLDAEIRELVLSKLRRRG